MSMLGRVASRFEIPLEILAGGSGTVMGVISENPQKAQPSYVYTAPRDQLRVRQLGLLKPGVVVRTPDGIVYMVGYNGPSEVAKGHLWDSFMLFLATGQYLWQRRIKSIDPVTRLPQDGGLENMGTIWGSFAPMDRETSDRAVHASFEMTHFIVGEDVRSDDVLDNKKVTRADDVIGLRIGTLT